MKRLTSTRNLWLRQHAQSLDNSGYSTYGLALRMAVTGMIYASSCTILARRPAVPLTLQDLPEISLDTKLQMLLNQMWMNWRVKS
jgi:hypothetical protein